LLKEDETMRALSPKFLHDLNPEEGGKYGEIVKRVRRDKDLDLEFRGNYINIYYQGHIVLLLRQNGSIELDESFTKNGFNKLPAKIPNISKYLELLPYIKDNVACHLQKNNAGKTISKQNRESEFEQLLIRANNRESRNNSEYIIIDRQYVVRSGNKTDKWDLIALRYPSNKRPPKGYLSIIEVKYGSNLVISDIVKQVERYGQYYVKHKNDICTDMEKLFKQKLELDLITRTSERLVWLEGLSLVEDIESTEIILYLIDCNPTKIKELENAEKPNFQGKAHIASGGLALWQTTLRNFGEK
jgi:hypothetical protein